MNPPVHMRVLELIAARLCHELISPVAAIGNGVELLTEEEAEFAREAVALVGEATRTAAGRLQFYRFALGFGPGGTLTGPPPHELAAAFFAGSKVACHYSEAVRALPLETQKLACNLLVVGVESLPRGGVLRLGVGVAGLEVEGIGEGCGVAPQSKAALSLAIAVEDLTSRTIGAYFTGLLAAGFELRVVASDGEAGRFRLSTVPSSDSERRSGIP